MTTPFNQDINVGEPPVLLQKPRGFGVLGLLAGLVIIAGLSGLLWLNYDYLVAASAAKPGGSSSGPAAPAESEPSPSMTDFQALQQQTTESLQSTGQLVEAQRAELKRLSDQVAALTARIEQLQAPAAANAPARGANPLPRVAAEPPRVATPPRPAPVAPRKRPAAPQPADSISLGGAPLPGAPVRSDR